MKYTKKEYIAYLNLAEKEGYLDSDFVTDILNRKAWAEVHKMMEKGDYLV